MEAFVLCFFIISL